MKEMVDFVYLIAGAVVAGLTYVLGVAMGYRYFKIKNISKVDVNHDGKDDLVFEINGKEEVFLNVDGKYTNMEDVGEYDLAKVQAQYDLEVMLNE